MRSGLRVQTCHPYGAKKHLYLLATNMSALRAFFVAHHVQPDRDGNHGHRVQHLRVGPPL